MDMVALGTSVIEYGLSSRSVMERRLVIVGGPRGILTPCGLELVRVAGLSGTELDVDGLEKSTVPGRGESIEPENPPSRGRVVDRGREELLANWGVGGGRGLARGVFPRLRRTCGSIVCLSVRSLSHTVSMATRRPREASRVLESTRRGEIRGFCVGVYRVIK